MSASVSSVRDRPVFIWGIALMRLTGLAAVIAVTYQSNPRPATHGRGLAITVTLALASVAWLVWMFTERNTRWSPVPLSIMGVCGGALGGLSPHSAAIAIAAVAALACAGTVAAAEIPIAIAAAAAVALAVSTLVVGGSTPVMLGYLALIGAGLGTGFIRMSYSQRADQAERLLEQIRLTQQAEARAAALGERTRIAREIHDILAHSLGALAMQLEAAQAQLTAHGAPADDPHVAKALACVERAGALVRSGLTETRRAVQALREDAGSLPDLLTALADLRAGTDAVSVHTTGTVRRLQPDATLALFRTAQEAVTNAAKHAPGRPVAIELEFEEHQVKLTASNPLPDPDRARPLSASGGGYGLAGLRERAELVGGTLTSRVEDDTWRVCVTIPA